MYKETAPSRLSVCSFAQWLKLFISEYLIKLRAACGAGTDHFDAERCLREREAFGSTIMGWRSSKTIDIYDHTRDGEAVLSVLTNYQHDLSQRNYGPQPTAFSGVRPITYFTKMGSDQWQTLLSSPRLIRTLKSKLPVWCRQYSVKGQRQMQTTDLRQIKAAIFDQAFTGKARVICQVGVVVAIRQRKGQLLAMIKGWGGRWCSVDCVRIECARRRYLL